MGYDGYNGDVAQSKYDDLVIKVTNIHRKQEEKQRKYESIINFQNSELETIKGRLKSIDFQDQLEERVSQIAIEQKLVRASMQQLDISLKENFIIPDCDNKGMDVSYQLRDKMSKIEAKIQGRFEYLDLQVKTLSHDISEVDHDKIKKKLQKLSKTKILIKEKDELLKKVDMNYQDKFGEQQKQLEKFDGENLGLQNELLGIKCSVGNSTKAYQQNCQKLEKIENEIHMSSSIYNNSHHKTHRSTNDNLKDADFFYQENLLKESKFQREQDKHNIDNLKNQQKDLESYIDSFKNFKKFQQDHNISVIPSNQDDLVFIMKNGKNSINDTLQQTGTASQMSTIRNRTGNNSRNLNDTNSLQKYKTLDNTDSHCNNSQDRNFFVNTMSGRTDRSLNTNCSGQKQFPISVNDVEVDLSHLKNCSGHRSQNYKHPKAELYSYENLLMRPRQGGAGMVRREPRVISDMVHVSNKKNALG